MSLKNIKPAIVAVGYNRPDSMKRLLLSVSKAYYPVDDIDLIISIDKSNRSDEVQRVAEGIEWKYGQKIIKRFSERQGLRRHILQCGDLSEKYGAVIILEDDLVVAPSFYHYTYQSVNRYAEDKHISGISLYSHAWNGYANLEFRPARNEYDIYFGQYSITWGQCWTAKQWKRFKKWYFENENTLPDSNPYIPEAILRWSSQSWGKYFVSYMAENDLYYVIPYNAFSTNFSEVGQHNAYRDTAHQVCLQQGCKTNYAFPDFADGIKYDCFFERVFSGNIAGIPATEVCVDLNGTKIDIQGKKYLLSTIKKSGFEQVASFGINMHPIDENITNSITGTGIYMYRVDGECCCLTGKDVSAERLIYDTYDLTWKQLLKAGSIKFIQTLKKKMRRRRQ